MSSSMTFLKVTNPYLKKKREHERGQQPQLQNCSCKLSSSSGQNKKNHRGSSSSSSRSNSSSSSSSTNGISNNIINHLQKYSYSEITSSSQPLQQSQHRPLFMDIFGSGLISQLITHKMFQTKLMEDLHFNCVSKGTKRRKSNTEKNKEEEEKGNERRLRLYWRTKCFPYTYPASASKGHQRDGHVYFLDVTVDFVKQKLVKKKKKMNTNGIGLARQNNNYDIEDQSLNENANYNGNECKQNQKEHLHHPQVQIQTRFGMLVKRFKKEERSTSLSSITAGLGRQNGNDTSTTVNATATSRKEEERGAVYMQTNELTKEELDQYARDIMIDLDDTGPIAMANVIAKALLAYNNECALSSSLGLGNTFDKKENQMNHCQIQLHNFDPPPPMHLYTVPIYRDSYSYDKKDELLSLKDRIGIYHMDIQEEGYIHFPCQSLQKREQEYNQQEYDEDQNDTITSGKIDEFALKMMLSNFILQDEERTKKKNHYSNGNMNCKNSNLGSGNGNDNDNGNSNDIVSSSSSSFSHGLNDGNEDIFKTWWNHYQRRNEEHLHDERTASDVDSMNVLLSGQTEDHNDRINTCSGPRSNLNQNVKEQGRDNNDAVKETSDVNKNNGIPLLPSTAMIAKQSTIHKKNDDSARGKKNKAMVAQNSNSNGHAMSCIRPRKKKRGKMTIRRAN